MKKSKILILCGGRGSRLGNLTDRIPKPLVEIKNQSILEYKLVNYKNQGYQDFIFCIGYKGNKIKAKVNELGFGGVYSEDMRFSQFWMQYNYFQTEKQKMIVDEFAP